MSGFTDEADSKCAVCGKEQAREGDENRSCKGIMFCSADCHMAYHRKEMGDPRPFNKLASGKLPANERHIANHVLLRLNIAAAAAGLIQSGFRKICVASHMLMAAYVNLVTSGIDRDDILGALERVADFEDGEEKSEVAFDNAVMALCGAAFEKPEEE